jgi:hypothetical protein
VDGRFRTLAPDISWREYYFLSLRAFFRIGNWIHPNTYLEEFHMRKVMLFLAVVGVAGTLLAADLVIGTWVLNPAHTKVTGSATAMSSGKAIFKAQGDGVSAVYDQVSAGSAAHGEYTAKYDGKDYPLKGDPRCDTVSLRKIDDYTLDYLFKKNGETVISERSVVSKDGKRATVTFKGKDQKGQDYTIVTVWEKQ